MRLSETDRLWVEELARSAGFDLAGLASVPDPDSESARREARRFAGWVESGAAGEMDWLKRADAEGALVRGDLRRSGGAGMEPAGEAAGSDYHEELLPKLNAVAAALRERFGEGCQARAYVDTGPILERGYAARAGVGWIGRNTCVLNQGQGSFLLLGVVVLSLDMAPAAVPFFAADRCGSCTRCIDACPTDALHGSGLGGRDRLMDASRCIAYLTIEKKGSIDPALREGMGRQVFGCDICQDVCPWNRRAPIGQSGMLIPRPALVNPPLADLAALDGQGFNRRFRGSPLERTRRKRLLRNVAIAMGNSGEESFRPQLEAWVADVSDPVLAEAAQWALGRLERTAGCAVEVQVPFPTTSERR